MFRYLFLLTFLFAFTACESDDAPPEQPPPQDPMQGQMQQQAPALDIDVTSNEIDQFVEAAIKAQDAQMEAQQEMIDVVDEEGISVETYNQIAQAVQMGQPVEDIDVTAEQLEQYDRASELIEEIEETLRSNIEEVVENTGMDFERFQEINMAAQQDPALRQQIEEKMQETQMQTPPGDFQDENY